MNDFRYQDQRPSQQNWTPQSHWNSVQPLTAAQVSIQERLGFIRKVYSLLFASILFALLGVAIGVSTPPLMLAITQNRWITFFIMIGAVMGAQAVRHVKGVNLVALFGFTTLTGIMLSPLLFLLNRTNPNSILQAGVLTIGIFGGLTAYAFLSKRDLSFLGGLLGVGLIVIVIGAVLNLFLLSSSAFGFAISAGALLLFAGFVLYDTSNIIRHYPINEYVAAALSLYLDALNIFVSLLRLLNSGRN